MGVVPDLTDTGLEVPAEPDAVLRVLADLPTYPQRASGVTRAEVLATDDAGRPARARLTVTGGLGGERGAAILDDAER